MDIVINAEARAKLRAAITGHVGWRAYKEAAGKGIAEFSKQDYLTACQVLGLDAKAIIESTEEKAEMKPRTKTRYEVDALRTRFDLAVGLMTQDEADKGRAIFTTIGRQDGAATDAQFAAIERLISATSGRAAGTGKAVETSPIVAQATGTEPVLDPAGKALADMVAPHLLGSIMPSVMGAVAQRLENVSTVKIEMVRDGVKVGETTGHHHPKFALLCKLLSARDVNGFTPSVWISGPSGSGKTHAVKQFAKAAGLPYYGNGSISMPHELLGYQDGNGQYHTTEFRRAYEQGGVYLFDECDGSENAALLALNAALANGSAAFPDKAIERHKDCVIIATGNTFGLGATSEYVGRGKIDMAFLDRFGGRIHWNYDEALEIAISGNPDFARRVQAARHRASQAGLKVLITPRASIAGAAYIAQGLSSDEAAQITYLANMTQDQQRIVEGR